MNRFDEEGIAFTVAVVDMDWHLVISIPNTERAGRAIPGIRISSRIRSGSWMSFTRGA